MFCDVAPFKLLTLIAVASSLLYASNTVEFTSVVLLTLKLPVEETTESLVKSNVPL